MRVIISIKIKTTKIKSKKKKKKERGTASKGATQSNDKGKRYSEKP